MKKLFVLFILAVLASCNANKKYSDFDYSFARHGGYAPIYENLWIKGNTAHYSFEGEGKKMKKDFKVSGEELKNIEDALTKNSFRTIREDLKKVYDYRSTSINVKKGPNSGSKSDASFIMENDRPRWNNIVSVFQQIIDSNVDSSK
ncbi:hypothetical protein J4771_12050 [Candidatus Kaistella beijingensis]|uniref:hypothetical protein n=1 Tax=Candidatus Kaistella beijingensis TaxID=2820270 RepID=UPI000ECCAA8D|nr:hypothetical protein [Candidatus Kaistella beijingensis]UBB89573.1 hypothetical protein J4771_12050 [Candidatus Kaistella beijingensis]HCN12283.1 hypothetical protein [Chryseobacterium sp.]